LIGSTTSRYRHPIEPALFLLAALGQRFIFADSKARGRRMWIAIPWEFRNLIAIGFSNQAKFAMRTMLEGAGVW